MSPGALVVRSLPAPCEDLACAPRLEARMNPYDGGRDDARRRTRVQQDGGGAGATSSGSGKGLLEVAGGRCSSGVDPGAGGSARAASRPVAEASSAAQGYDYGRIIALLQR